MESVIAGNIKSIIHKRGYKRSAIAVMAGYPPPANFNNMLNSRKQIADYDITPIATALGVTPNDLFFVTWRKQWRLRRWVQWRST